MLSSQMLRHFLPPCSAVPVWRAMAGTLSHHQANLLAIIRGVMRWTTFKPVRRCGHVKLCVCAAKVWTY